VWTIQTEGEVMAKLTKKQKAFEFGVRVFACGVIVFALWIMVRGVTG
jgi:hypothetical protein